MHQKPLHSVGSYPTSNPDTDESYIAGQVFRRTISGAASTGGVPDHDHTASGDGGKLTADVHDSYSRWDAVALPTGINGSALIAAVDVGGSDVRVAFVGDTGDECYAGNGTFSSGGALGLQSVGNIDIGTDGNATNIAVGTTGVTAINIGHVSATTSIFGTFLHDGAQATLAAQSNGVVYIGGGAVVSVMRFYEGSGNGTNYVGLQPPTALGASQDYTLPDAVPTENGQLMACTTLGVLSFCGVKVDSSALQPVTNDGIALGVASTGEFSDLFGATGFVINIANGNWVATHTSAILTVGTGDLRMTTAGTDDTSVLTRQSTNVYKNWVSGLEMRYSSATAVIIATGVARADSDTTNIVLSSETTVSIATLQAAAGLDEKNLSGTTASNNSTTLTGTSTAFLTEFGTRNLTGTISSAATTVTGTGTKFLSEVTVGDLIGASSASSTAKFARVTAIASDTSLTVSATLTISGGTTGVVIENCTVKHDAGGTPQPRRVDQIQSDTTVIVTAAFTGGSLSGKSARAGCEVIDTWIFPWLVSGGSGVTVILSTQRTTPFGVTGYTTSKRRIGSLRNDDGGDFIEFNQTGSGRTRTYQYEVDVAAHNTRLLSAGTATAWTALMAHQVAPYSAHTLLTMGIVYKPGAEAAIYLRKRNSGEAAVARNLGTRSLTSDMGWTFAPCACDGAQGIDYVGTTGSGSPSYVDLVGYVEDI